MKLPPPLSGAQDTVRILIIGENNEFTAEGKRRKKKTSFLSRPPFSLEKRLCCNGAFFLFVASLASLLDGVHMCLLVLVCAMDCNLRVQLIHIYMPVQEWTAIPKSKVPQVLLNGMKMNEP